jgi:hypothetical protein
MEGHRLNMIGEQERQARMNKSANVGESKDRPDRIFAPTLVVKNTDNYKPLDGHQVHSNGDASAFDKMSLRLEGLEGTINRLMQQLQPDSAAAADTRMGIEEDVLDTTRARHTTGGGILPQTGGKV